MNETVLVDGIHRAIVLSNIFGGPVLVHDFKLWISDDGQGGGEVSWFVPTLDPDLTGYETFRAPSKIPYAFHVKVLSDHGVVEEEFKIPKLTRVFNKGIIDCKEYSKSRKAYSFRFTFDKLI